MMYILTEEEYQKLKNEAISQHIKAEILYTKWVMKTKMEISKEIGKHSNFDPMVIYNPEFEKLANIFSKIIENVPILTESE